MKKLFTIIILITCLTSIKAQYVTIPDANFVNWLQTNLPSAMNGNQMDTTSLSVTTRISVSIQNKSINNLSGIQYFDSLRMLDCGNIPYNANANTLINMPRLPNKLKTLACYNNQLSSLPTLPPTLDTLLCYTNFITSLPNLPNQLTYLNCGSNALDSLPFLPNSIKYLYCSGPMNVYYLPSLPNSLITLSSRQLLLNSLPNLPNTLINLDCSLNPLDSLPPLPNSLKTLSIGYCHFSNMPTLPNGLISLTCNNNVFSNIQNLNDSLVSFDCSNNQLTTLPTLPNTLTNLNCMLNQITSLPSLPDNLQYFSCSYNNLSCFPTFPNSFTNYGNYIFDISHNLFSCLPNYIAAMDAATLAFPLCSYGNINQCPVAKGIVGYVYSDNVIPNCLKDNGDLNQVNVPLKIYNQSGNLLGTTYSAINGVYSFPQFNNTYTVLIDTTSIPIKAQCLYPGIDSTFYVSSLDTNINFAMTCKNGFDLGIQSVTNTGIVFPGQQHTLKILAGDMSHWFNLNCANGISGQVQITVNGNVSYDGPSLGSLIPTVNGNIFTYNILDFGLINNSNDFNLLFTTDSNAQAGDSICANVTITTNLGDNNPSNNLYKFCYEVVNSFDPNIKEVYPINVMPGFNNWLTYTIHFQNTGNAPAFNIRLLDTLDSKLDLSAFEVINYSHTANIILNNRLLTVYYPNIMLPDSASNPDGSIGFVQYRIKPKANWVAPYKIKNRAYIYFDYNAPIVTNTTYNSIIVPTGLNNKSETIASIYPNPTKSTFTIELKTKEKQFVQLMDLTGNVVLSKTIENDRATIDVSYLAAGIYNISIKGNDSVSNKKLVIVK